MTAPSIYYTCQNIDKLGFILKKKKKKTTAQALCQHRLRSQQLDRYCEVEDDLRNRCSSCIDHKQSSQDFQQGSPWPYLNDMFEVEGDSYRLKCLLCLPRVNEISAFETLSKHIEVS